MKKILVVGVLCCSLPSLAVGRGGGESFAGGLAGGMFGGLMSGAMTRESAPRSSSVSASVVRELDKLENAVRYDLVKLDERIRALERSSGGSDSSDSQALQQEIRALKKSIKTVEASLESKIEAIEDRLAVIEKRVKSIEVKVKKDTGRDLAAPVATRPVKLKEQAPLTPADDQDDATLAVAAAKPVA
jgi:succinate dehydrogenase/fumarate reductase flavoprotein subunit